MPIDVINLYLCLKEDKVKRFKQSLLVLTLLVSCTAPTPSATLTPEPSYTPTKIFVPSNSPIPTFTPSMTLTMTPTNTPEPTPVSYVILGSPFPADCGDGVPRIWSNDSFNGPFDISRADDRHGHVDIFPPDGCNPAAVTGELIAAATGVGSTYGDGLGYRLVLPRNVFPLGIEEALEFAGYEKLDLSKISKIILDFGHVAVKNGPVEKGNSIGELVGLPSWMSHRYKIGYQIFIWYEGDEIALSPTLFEQDGPEWTCVQWSPYDCEPEPQDYAP
jgi:hypothetical protein